MIEKFVLERDIYDYSSPICFLPDAAICFYTITVHEIIVYVPSYGKLCIWFCSAYTISSF